LITQQKQVRIWKSSSSNDHMKILLHQSIPNLLLFADSHVSQAN